MAESTEKYTLQYVRSPDFRAVVPDGINLLAVDSSGRPYVVLTATSDEILTEAETFEAEVSEEGVKQTGERKFQRTARKVEEAAFKLTPRLATQLAILLIRNLDTLAPGAAEEIKSAFDKIESK